MSFRFPEDGLNTPVTGFLPFEHYLPKDLSAVVSAFQRMDLQQLNQLYAQYLQDSSELWRGVMAAFDPDHSSETDGPGLAVLDKFIEGDRRFSADAWRDRGFFEWNAAVYSLNARYTQRMLDLVQADEKTKTKLKYGVTQFLDAVAPSNFFVTNPEAQRKVLETSGESLGQSVGNLLEDLRKGRISQTDESAFAVGVNVATTAGAVVYENEIFQLIQYTPLTETVAAAPMLFIPPCINKFYILDLQPENSMVRFMLEQGHPLFLMSWKNPTDMDCRHTWDDYVEHGILRAIEVTRAIAAHPAINVMGFCVGGTLLCTALCVLHARKQAWVSSVSLVTTLLDFQDAGLLGVFIDDTQVVLREQTVGDKGLVAGRDLSAAFSSLRPNDLIWNYVVSNYLKGEKPPAFDLLYWNADSTNLPGPMFCWYLRNTYLDNTLKHEGQAKVCGVPIDFSVINMPMYLMAAKEDHIVPWSSAYASAKLLQAPIRFVLGASGHIAGVVNPVSKNKRSYWIHPSDVLPEHCNDWLAAATEQSGSWWRDWAKWLEAYRGGEQDAPKSLGSEIFPMIEPAPGRYVKVRTV